MKLHPSIGARIRVITDNYSHETHEKTRNIIYIIVLGLSRRSPAGVQVLWPLWARGQIQESLLSALSFPNPQSTITVLSFPTSRRGVGVGPYGPEAAFPIPFASNLPLFQITIGPFREALTLFVERGPLYKSPRQSACVCLPSLSNLSS